MCDSGYAFANGTCVRKFDCPPNATSTITYPLSSKDCACDPGFTLQNSTCQLTANAGLSATAIAGIAAGAAVLVGSGAWGIANLKLLLPPSITPPLVPPSNPVTGIRMDFVFAQDRYLINAV